MKFNSEFTSRDILALSYPLLRIRNLQDTNNILPTTNYTFFCHSNSGTTLILCDNKIYEVGHSGADNIWYYNLYENIKDEWLACYKLYKQIECIVIHKIMIVNEFANILMHDVLYVIKTFDINYYIDKIFWDKEPRIKIIWDARVVITL